MQASLSESLSGFGNYFSSEAIAGALPVGQNSPQRPNLGLYAELLSGTAFTAPRADNLRTWVYRLLPSAGHTAFTPWQQKHCQTAPLQGKASPEQMRWNALPIPATPCDFIEGLVTVLANGDAAAQIGMGVHLYACNQSMVNRVFYSADGEFLLVPQDGSLIIKTELGLLTVSPGEIALLPRGIRFSVKLVGSHARGYVCENYGAAFRLPELGPLGSNGLANPRDFIAPNATFEDSAQTTELIAKFAGGFWSAQLNHSPFNVVAWHGNLTPLKYNLAHFMAIGSISFDHPDPSIFTVLTSPSDTAGTANVDFVIFPPRWLVAENTFRPPWFHRNVMSEYMGLIKGVYDAKAEGFVPGGGSLHNSWSAHGPDQATHTKASHADLKPHALADTMAFMFESRYALAASDFAKLPAKQGGLLQTDYVDCWQGFKNQHLQNW